MTQRAYRIAEAAVAMIAMNFQRGEFMERCTGRDVAGFRMVYMSDARCEPEPESDVPGNGQGQRFDCWTQYPLSGEDAAEVVQAVEHCTSRELVADTDVDGATWGFATEEGDA